MIKPVFVVKRAIVYAFIFMLLSNATALSLNAYLTDNADKITPEYKTKIEDLIVSIEENSSVEIAVLTVKDMGGKSIEEFSIDVAQSTGVGKKGKDNGILITIAESERKWRIEVGYGLEGTLTDAQAKIIGEHYLKPQLTTGNWGKGIFDTVEQINIELKKEKSSETINTTPENTSINRLLVTLVVVIIFILIIHVIPIIYVATENGQATDEFIRPTSTHISSISSKKKKRKTEEISSYHSSGRSDEETHDHTDYHHSYYSGGYDSSDDDSSYSSTNDSGFGGGSFGGGGASGGF